MKESNPKIVDIKKRSSIEQILKITKEWHAYEANAKSSIALVGKKYAVSNDDLNSLYDLYGFDYCVNKILDIYMRYFSQDDLDKILEFFRSEIGKKLSNAKMVSDIVKFHVDWANQIDASGAERRTNG